MSEASSTSIRINRRTLVKCSAAGGAAAAMAGSARFTALAQDATPGAAAGTAKSVIFMMGDGMGQPHRDFGQLATVGAYDRMVMDTLPILGLQGTNSVTPDSSELITDSAASATAFATGVKTFNGAIGVDPSGATVTNLAELAKAAGKAVGLVTTSQVTDASPAAFAAHVDDRNKQSEIARQYITDNKVDVILGGGEDRWLPAGSAGAYPDSPAEDPDEASSGDQGDLIAEAQANGYQYISDAAGLQSATGPLLLGLFANEEMFQQRPEGEGDIYEPVVSLNDMVTKAIEILSQNPNGFLLFVEEEAIDEFSHNNNAPQVLKGLQNLDVAVATALDFATTAGDILLVVTADHECGGLTIEGPGDEQGTVADGPFAVANSGYQFKVDWSTQGHTGVRVPLTAFGPGSEQFVGYYENIEIFVKLVTAFGFELPASAGATPVPGVSASDATPVASPAS